MTLYFLEGAAGSGKTTRAVQHLKQLLEDGVEPRHILVLVPQRTPGRPYQEMLSRIDVPGASSVDVVTFGGLARRAVELYWPVVAEKVVPEWNGQKSRFLTIETAQYYMAEFVDPAIKAGLFDGISMERSRIVAQTLDNLSKAAVNRFSYTEIAPRLAAAWGGKSSRLRVYDTVAEVIQKYRSYCLERGLLDFSLQIDLFMQHIVYEKFYKSEVEYLVADNVEENYPATIDYVNWLQRDLKDAFLVYDRNAGFRVFLGASPEYAYELNDGCEKKEITRKSVYENEGMDRLVDAVVAILDEKELPVYDKGVSPLDVMTIHTHSFYPKMIDWVVNDTVRLVMEDKVAPRNIAIFAPYMSDTLRFSLLYRFEQARIPVISSRPSRAIRDESVAQAALTLMALACPAWGFVPPRERVAIALMETIDGLDPIRARLLVEVVCRPGKLELGSFDVIRDEMQRRITYVAGECYEKLRNWLLTFHEKSFPPDYFLRALFDFATGEGYRFGKSLDAGRVIAQLVDSAFQFREVIAPEGKEDWTPIIKQYAELVGDGVLAAFHPSSWRRESENAVFISPAHTYLMRNRPVDYQFWLDVGSPGWFERVDEPLTHPYVLQRDYDGQVWTDTRENKKRYEMLRMLLVGLLRRCRRRVYIGVSEMGEYGYEQRGVLLNILNVILKNYQDNANG